jgi:hypothetical protein
LPTSLAPVSFVRVTRGESMKRLILTTDGSGAGGIGAAGLADFVVTLGRRLVWGPPLSRAQVDAFFAARTTLEEGFHWQDYTPAWRLQKSGGWNLGLIEFCANYDSIELWVDPDPNAQLNLIWLLDFLHAHESLAARMNFVQAEFKIGGRAPEELAKWQPPRVAITGDHLDAASSAWRAWCSPTPQAWFNLLAKDLSILPQLRSSVLELLEELPGRVTGVSATEMRMLEIISKGNAGPRDVQPGHKQSNKRRVFDYWEVGELLDGLAHCPAPAVAGLAKEPFTLEMHDDLKRHQRYTRSKLSLTALGEAILAGTGDFSRHNPIHRWWGGTGLTNDRLWRWDAADRTLVAP